MVAIAAREGRVAGVATGKSGGPDEHREGAGRGRRGRRGGRGAPEAPETPESADRARDMVMVDPWGALLAGLLEVPEGEEEPAGAGPAKGAAKKK
jgi:hypothetical protein